MGVTRGVDKVGGHLAIMIDDDESDEPFMVRVVVSGSADPGEVRKRLGRAPRFPLRSIVVQMTGPQVKHLTAVPWVTSLSLASPLEPMRSR